MTIRISAKLSQNASFMRASMSSPAHEWIRGSRGAEVEQEMVGDPGRRHVCQPRIFGARPGRNTPGGLRLAVLTAQWQAGPCTGTGSPARQTPGKSTPSAQKAQVSEISGGDAAS